MKREEIIDLIKDSKRSILFTNSYKKEDIDLFSNEKIFDLTKLLEEKGIKKLYIQYIYPLYSEKKMQHFFIKQGMEHLEKILLRNMDKDYGFNFYGEKILWHIRNNFHQVDLNKDIISKEEISGNEDRDIIKDDVTEQGLEKFDDMQKEAILHTFGPCIVLAPAGSGKTSVLIERIIQLIKKGIEPKRILAMTFTNKASEEMKQRLKLSLGIVGQDVEVRTYHSLCHKHMGASLTLLPENMRWKVLKQMEQSGLNHGKINKKLIETITKKVLNFEPLDKAQGDILQCYIRCLKELKYFDFSLLMIDFLDKLKKDYEFRSALQSEHKFILIDECQDNNKSMQMITKILGAPEDNLFWVGDDDQCIYTFAGSSIDNILNLSEEYPSIKSIYLEYNYRCSREIVEAATNVIVSNNKRELKVIKPAPNKVHNEKAVEYLTFESLTQEIEHIIDYCKNYASRDKKIAILYRKKFYVQELITKLRENKLKFYIKEQFNLLEISIIRIIHGYLMCILGAAKKDDWKAILKYKIKYISAEQLEILLKSENIFDGINATMETLEGNQNYLRESLTNFISEYEMIKERLLGEESLNEKINYLASFLNLLYNIDSDEKDAFEAYCDISKECKDILELSKKIEGVKLDNKLQEEDFNILLFTIHTSKGKQFDTVFLIGLEEGTLPSSRVSSVEQSEEERRVCYVGITRAISKIFIVNALDKGMPSRFIDESKEPKMECYTCHKHIAKKEYNLCGGCKEYFCHNDMDTCDICGKGFCKACQKNLPSSYINECSWCETKICSQCYTSIECKSCGLSYCSSCINSKTGLCEACLKKNYINGTELKGMIGSDQLFSKKSIVEVGIAKRYIVYFKKKFFGLVKDENIRIKRV